MADDERRAEIEAVAEALWLNNRLDGKPQGYPYERLIEPTRADLQRLAEAAIAALDRVRDARGDDECTCAPTTGTDYEPHDPGCPKARARDAQGDDEAGPVIVVNGEEVGRGENGMLNALDRMVPARSPQAEDHETARPEQPPPDTLGGQPPAEPPEAP